MSSDIPTRSNTVATNSSTFTQDLPAVPEGEDISEVTKLFSQRLSAWRHAVSYLIDYVEATEKLHKESGKEYERVLKTVSSPLKEGENFDQSLGGIAGAFDNIRSNTQGISNSHYETAKTIKGTVLPIFERLHTEIKHKSKELLKGAGKGAKTVDKARNATQKHIELLGQHTASFDYTGGKLGPQEDPYVIRRLVLHRLNKQVLEENNNREDLIAVQQSFGAFEKTIVQSIQTGMGQFNTVISKQMQETQAMYGDMVATTQRVPPDFEWNGFIKRSSNVLIDPSVPQRAVENITFPNQDHRATKPLISGSLERKGKLIGRYDTSYYVVTPAKFLHEFKTDDDFGKEPTPELSLFLPDCVVGAVDGQKFNVKGKDVSKGSIGNKLSMSHELKFKAHTAADAAQWWEVIRSAAGQTTNEIPEASVPTSPVSTNSSQQQHQQGITETAGFSTPIKTDSLPQESTGSTPQSATPGTPATPGSATVAAGSRNVSGAHPQPAATPGNPPYPTSPIAGADDGVVAQDHNTVAPSAAVTNVKV